MARQARQQWHSLLPALERGSQTVSVSKCKPACPRGPWYESASSRGVATLAHEEVVVRPSDAGDSRQAGAGMGTGMVLHGLLGTGRNLRSFARRVAEGAAQQTGRSWRQLLVDLRCHGASARLPGLQPPHTLETAANDLFALQRSPVMGGAPPDVLMGHSMGGKVALEYLRQLKQQQAAADSTEPTSSAGTGAGATARSQHAPRESSPAGSGTASTARGGAGNAAVGQQHAPAPKHVWVLDSQPGQLSSNNPADTDVDRVIREIEHVPLPVPSRDWLYKYMAERGYSQGLRQWLGSNLVPAGAGDQLRWAFDIAGAAALYHSYKRNAYWDVLEAPPPGTTLHLVRAARSDRWSDDLIKRVKDAVQRNQELQQQRGAAGVGRFQYHVLPNAGHWLHVDNPDGLAKLIVPSYVDVLPAR